MKIEWIQSEEEQTKSIVGCGKSITKLAHKFLDGEELSETDRYLITKYLFWLGRDMSKKPSRYLEPKKQGRKSELPNFDILTEYYSYILDEGKTQAYAFEKLMEKYEISDTTIKNMINEIGEEVMRFWHGDESITHIKKK